MEEAKPRNYLTPDDKRWIEEQLKRFEANVLAVFKLTPEQRSAIARKAGLAGGRGRKKES